MTEGRELPQKDIDYIAKMTDQNNHNQARLHLAQVMRNRHLEKAYQAVITLHQMFNQMNEMMGQMNGMVNMMTQLSGISGVAQSQSTAESLFSQNSSNLEKFVEIEED